MPSASTNSGSVLRFGVFELDTRSGELRRDNAPVKLPPQPLKILVSLASHPGELQTREEIQNLVWKGETFVDFELGLNYCLNQIRKVLGDDARTPHFIETIPRRGYRFIAPVQTIEEPSGRQTIHRRAAVCEPQLRQEQRLLWRRFGRRNHNGIDARTGVAGDGPHFFFCFSR